MKTKEEIIKTLPSYRGTEYYYKHPISRLVYTDGVLYLAESADCHWLIDAIASWQLDPKVRTDPMLKRFQLWELKVTKRSAILRCLRDTDDPVLEQKIPFTDFPLDEIKLYVERGVLLLPSEN